MTGKSTQRFLLLGVWGKNITNERYVSRSVDFGALGFATAIWSDPATYGIDVEFTF